jgi:hypothetical protein
MSDIVSLETFTILVNSLLVSSLSDITFLESTIAFISICPSFTGVQEKIPCVVSPATSAGTDILPL